MDVGLGVGQGVAVGFNVTTSGVGVSTPAGTVVGYFARIDPVSAGVTSGATMGVGSGEAVGVDGATVGPGVDVGSGVLVGAMASTGATVAMAGRVAVGSACGNHAEGICSRP